MGKLPKDLEENICILHDTKYDVVSKQYTSRAMCVVSCILNNEKLEKKTKDYIVEKVKDLFKQRDFGRTDKNKITYLMSANIFIEYLDKYINILENNIIIYYNFHNIINYRMKDWDGITNGVLNLNTFPIKDRGEISAYFGIPENLLFHIFTLLTDYGLSMTLMLLKNDMNIDKEKDVVEYKDETMTYCNFEKFLQFISIIIIYNIHHNGQTISDIMNKTCENNITLRFNITDTIKILEQLNLANLTSISQSTNFMYFKKLLETNIGDMCIFDPIMIESKSCKDTNFVCSEDTTNPLMCSFYECD